MGKAVAKKGEPNRVRVGKKNQLTLPRKALTPFGLEEGDYFELRVLEDRIELVPMALVPRDQAWFWTPEWQAKERAAEKARKTGRHREYKSAAKAVAALRS